MDTLTRHVVVVGATSTIAQHCLRLWLQQGPATVTLIGRDGEGLQSVADDLAVRCPSARIATIATSLTDPISIAACLDRIAPPTLALVAHGWLTEQARCEADLAYLSEGLLVNGVSPAIWAEGLAQRMASLAAAQLVVMGSVAGDRGRASNYAYGAAKGLLERYCQGLQHRFAHTGLAVTLVKPCPTATPMTASLAAQGRALAPVENVAARIVRGVARAQRVVYAPAKWWLIMQIIRHLPFVIFKRLQI